MMVIGQRPFKVTCYFIECLKNFDQVGDATFSWQLLYIEAYLHSIDTTLTIALTEKDLKQLVSMLRETTIHQSKGEIQIDTDDILRPTLSHKQIMNLALDVITFKPSTSSLQVSFDLFQKRIKERKLLETNFQETGGKYIKVVKNQPDPEFAQYSTSIPHTELTKKLVVSVEKDFSDSKVDIKVYITQLQSKQDWQKIQVEIFSIEEPSLIYRCDYLSRSQQNGRQLLIERFNLSQQGAEAQA